MNRPFLIAELGINFNGDLDIARRLIDAAVEHNWNAVKFQKRTVEKVIPREMWHIKKETSWGIIDYIDYKKRLEFGKEEYDLIDDYCRQKKIDWFASAWDMESQEFLDRYDLKYNKIASPMITYHPLLEHVASLGKLTFISTGMATDEQITKAVNIFEENDCPFVLMHCVGLYPCPLEKLNLSRIETLRNHYGCHVGYSGHSEGAMDAVLAATLGAEFIEKHITLNRAMYGSDQASSIEPSGMEFISKHVHHIPVMLGDGKKHVDEEEEKIAKKLRYWG
ncbi:MAG: N-acetylneuraminate synthase family protein [bacterium]